MSDTRKPDYCIGIDLGTTHCALSYIDLASAGKSSQVLKIQQKVSPESDQELELLPSALALPAGHTEWHAGAWAEALTTETPERVVTSAKSWLCHAHIDRNQKILPWHSDDIESKSKLSPVEASTRFLLALKEQWDNNSSFPPFNDQVITITVPASFDQSAQELTLIAAKKADYPENINLIEEPQAAFYFFLEKHKRIYENSLLPRKPLTILICDIGGGTTDFSLLVLDDQEELERVDVSNHILLGGDNIDLALAHRIESKFQKKLETKQWHILVSHARAIKEKALSPHNSLENFAVNIPTVGSDLFADPISAEISKDEILTIVLDGFFPECQSTDRPQKNSGLRELGLPYATDTAFTRHLAAFLRGRRVDAILCTGGTLIPQALQSRIKSLIERWQEKETQVLPNDAMTLAVARGAARYGYSIQHDKPEIKSGYPHAVYLHLEGSGRDETQSSCICLLPHRTPPGVTKVCDKKFEALLGTEVKFQLLTSSLYSEDRSGDIRPIEEGFHPLPAFQSILACPLRERGKTVEVSLSISVTEVGLLELTCAQSDSDRKWELKLNLRLSGTEDKEKSSAQPELAEAQEFLESAWGKSKRGQKPVTLPKSVPAHLEKLTGTERNSWDVQTLRSLWNYLSPGITRRSRSLLHESQFFALAGFVLRPGYGAALDELRMAELWKVHELGLSHRKETRVLQQWWIMWRRVAGGLSSDQQLYLFKSVEQMFLKEPECLRMVCSFEYLPKEVKKSLATKLIKHLNKKSTRIFQHHTWSLQRLTNRIPVYADPIYALPPEDVIRFYTSLGDLIKSHKAIALAFLDAFRLSGDRSNDIPDEHRLALDEILNSHGVRESERAILHSVVPREARETAILVGDNLPAGLTLKNS